jgi:ubiquitin-protein ligase
MDDSNIAQFVNSMKSRLGEWGIPHSTWSVNHIKLELEALATEYNVELSPTTLMIDFPDFTIVYEGNSYDFGPFTIQLDSDLGWQCFPECGCDNTVFHPCVAASGTICLGLSSGLAATHIYRANLVDSFDIVKSVLTTYTGRSNYYAKIHQLGMEACYECGDIRDDMMSHCGVTYCYECLRECQCGTGICEHCSRSCDCGVLVCDACELSCNCGNNICDDCVVICRCGEQICCDCVKQCSCGIMRCTHCVKSCISCTSTICYSCAPDDICGNCALELCDRE